MSNFGFNRTKTRLTDASYRAKLASAKRVSFFVRYILCLIVLCSVIIHFFIFSAVSDFKVISADSEGGRSLIFVTPMAAPLPKTDSQPNFLLSLMHSVPLNRGDLVYVRPTMAEKPGFFHNILEKFIRFWTLQKIFPSSRPNLVTENHTFRRLVAVPGDTIYMKDSILYVKPQGEEHFFTEFELTSKPYNLQITPPTHNFTNTVGISQNFDARVLGKNEFFLLADNRDTFFDSRIWGTIHASQIVGKAVALYFPFPKMRLL